jgi:putative pyruvate formate lyase activating enzyme
VALEPAYLRLAREGELERREAALWEMYRECRLCPRGCGVNRIAGEVGVCSSTARVKVYGAVPHHGEERPLVGSGGSGTVFFSCCNLLCCFCQNWEINHRGDGRVVSHRELAAMMLDLQDRGCQNINLVTPSHVVPNIVRALRHAVAGGLSVPLVYNTGGYDGLEAIRLLDGIVDIYLPDLKYTDGAMAARYSSGAEDYPEVAGSVIAEMYRQVGDLVVDHQGNALRGLIVRHLVMPENVAGTDQFVRWVARELSPSVYVNLMDQYHPAHRSDEFPEIHRRITADEWRQALDWAEAAGLSNLDV